MIYVVNIEKAGLPKFTIVKNTDEGRTLYTWWYRVEPETYERKDISYPMNQWGGCTVLLRPGDSVNKADMWYANASSSRLSKQFETKKAACIEAAECINAMQRTSKLKPSPTASAVADEWIAGLKAEVLRLRGLGFKV